MSEGELHALLLSMQVAIACVLISIVPATASAYCLTRFDFRGKTLVDSIIHLPLVVPPVVVGYLLLLLLGRNGAVGKMLYEMFGIQIPFTWFGAALASALMGFPLMVRSIRLAIELIDPKIESAAHTLGASPLRVLFTITLPMALPGIAAGALIGFARSLGEFGATITFAGNIAGETRTLPLALFTEIQTPGGDHAAMRLAIISLLLAFATLAFSELLSRKARTRRESHA